MGSSPRVRGKHLDPAHHLRGAGLIPACAGKTCKRVNAGILDKAHPRVCGENLDNAADNLSRAGSSPRVRGKQPRARVQLLQ